MADKVPTVTLASGQQMPQVGFGLWKVPTETCADTVYNAIKAGYRLFDGAWDYGNEREAGQGIRRAIKEGIMKREDLFITTKLWNTYHQKEIAMSMGRFQNDEWGLEYIDLYLIHFPVSLKYVDPAEKKYPGWDYGGKVELLPVPMQQTWEALEALVDEGVVRNIGVSNFRSQLVTDVQSYAKHPVAVLQIEHHPYLVQQQLVDFCKDNNIAVTAYSSFGPMSFMEMPPEFSDKAKGVTILFEADPVVKAAEKHGKTPGQVLLRWATQRGVSVIPKSTNEERMTDNLESCSFDLSEEEIHAISSLDKHGQLRFNDPGDYLKEKPLRIFA